MAGKITHEKSLPGGRLPHDVSLIAELSNYNPDEFIGTGVYSDRDIKFALAAGHIRIFPYDEESLNGTSYDVRLGEWFYLTDRVHNRNYFNPFDPDDVKRYFGEPQQAISNAEWCAIQKIEPFKGIPLDHPIIVLNPGERILAHTHEFIGINPPGTSQMQARSTWGRNGIVVCKDAGWGDPGYRGRWTMEIQNDNNERVVLPVNTRVAQIVFIHSGETEVNYGKNGKYYQTSNLIDDVTKWRPDTMLPRAFKDEIKPLRPLSPGKIVGLRHE